ncbi:hypothetical protein PP47_gp05 [Pectobacterium phage PP47]|uniref:Uncharacterized protein n=2 Tax=Pektosvirus TaxID=2732689 RepID=A0A3B8G4T4_9CAUD|nr:hypothetical protein HOR48_gp05 [Pectobacterium phage PP81]YP_009788702.1 hypothetical protein HOR52_gp05 [Pectobacterium phage PP47]AYM47364.1 hypothetical protein PP47_gp05 [Pectobacterium phage PP47]AYM47376.1 hypothetical protein PP81_gp05 [Pectobacterium phage PP81]
MQSALQNATIREAIQSVINNRLASM